MGDTDLNRRHGDISCGFNMLNLFYIHLLNSCMNLLYCARSNSPALWKKKGVGGTRALAHSGDPSPFGDVAKRIAFATRGRAGAADLFENPSGCWGFHVLRVWGGKKRVKFEDAFWRSLLGVFWSHFGGFVMFFWCCPRVKIV